MGLDIGTIFGGTGVAPAAALGGWMPAISSAAAFAGGVLQNKWAGDEAQAQREWQQGMSSTAHQREVADLRAAGLNPILSASRGGAVTPGGATAQQTDPISGAVSSALNAKRLEADLHLLEQNVHTSKAQERALGASAGRDNAQAMLADQQRLTEEHETVNRKAFSEISQSTAKGAKLEGEIDETKYGEIMRYLDRAIKSLTGSARSIRDVK